MLDGHHGDLVAIVVVSGCPSRGLAISRLGNDLYYVARRRADRAVLTEVIKEAQEQDMRLVPVNCGADGAALGPAGAISGSGR